VVSADAAGRNQKQRKTSSQNDQEKAKSTHSLFPT
jgi:hypothetical protein